jgi:hypothetical protein
MSKTSQASNNLHHVQNQWGGASAPWNEGGMWVIGCRAGQQVGGLNMSSGDGGKTFTGQVKYAGEGPIGLRATLAQCNTYRVDNQWGGPSAQWHSAGQWILGCRAGQHVVNINIESGDGGATMVGTITYAGEGPIAFRSERCDGGVVLAENQWGGSAVPWHPGGVWVMGCRDQPVVALNIDSNDGGKTLSGTMAYAGEGPIGFRAAAVVGNNYRVENQWGGANAPWHPGGTWLLGSRAGQQVVSVNLSSGDNGETFNGGMTYAGEGTIGLRAFTLPL